MRARGLVAAGMALLLGAGCSGDVRDGGRSSGVGAPGPTTTAAATDVAAEFVVPATIDEAHVNRVLVALQRVQGDVFRRIVATRAFSSADLVALRAIYLEPELSAQAQVFGELPAEVDKAKDPPGDNVVTVVRLLAATPTCIYAEVSTDFGQTVKEPPPPSRSFLSLRPSNPGTDPQGLNRTPWSIASVRREEEPGRCPG